MTVDYKQLIRRCKSYKSPGKEPKAQNLFDKFRAKSPSKTQPTSTSQTSHSLTRNKLGTSKPVCPGSQVPSNYKKSQSEKVRHVQPSSQLVTKPSLFEKFVSPKQAQDKSVGGFSDSESEDPIQQDDDEDQEVGNATSFSTPQYNDLGDDTPGLVYRPGVGITSTITSTTSSVSQKKEKLSDSLLNSSLNFNDPYNHSIPTATSPSKANMDDTFDYQPFRPISEPSSGDDEPYSSQDSARTSLVIEETSALSDHDEEVLLSDDDERLLTDGEEEDEEIPHLPEKDNRSDDELPAVRLDDIKGDSGIAGLTTNKLNGIPLSKEITLSGDESVFGPSVSPVKVKKTFQKKKSSPDVVEIIKDDEDSIIEYEYKKELENQTRAKLFETKTPVQIIKTAEHSRTKPKKTVEESPAKSSISRNRSDEESNSRDSSIYTPQKSIKSEEESDDEESEERKLQRQQKLEEIKQLKAKIFEKQWMQSKENSSSSSSSSDSESLTSDSNTSASPDNTDSDSDYSINSDASVKSEESESADTETSVSNNSDSDLPKRKRKRLSSPLHSQENTKVKPILALTPQQIKDRDKASKKKTSTIKSVKKEVKTENRPLKSSYTIQIDSMPSCKLKRKKEKEDALRQKEKLHKREKEKRREERKRKPIVSASMRSDKIIPHQQQIAQKKQKIAEKYDARLEKKKRDDNMKSFYQKKDPPMNSLMAKYKKEVSLNDAYFLTPNLACSIISHHIHNNSPL